MELNFDYKEGCYLFNGTTFPEVVIHKTVYKLVTITFQEWGDFKPFGFRVFDLTNKLDVELLNERYIKTVTEQDPDKPYGIKIGTIVEYDYSNLIFLRIIFKKVLSFELQRPLLFDYIKARDKYLAFDALDKVYSLQNEFNASWEQYFRVPLESKENIDWDIKSEPIPLEPRVNESLLRDEFGNKFTDSITVYDFLSVIDTDTFNKIPNEEIKDEISKLIKKTLEIAKENDAIGKEDLNKKPKQKTEKFYIELTYTKDGEQISEIEEIDSVNQFEALDLAKKGFYDKYEGKDNIELLFVSPVDKPNDVVPKYVEEKIPETGEEIFKEGVQAKKERKKKAVEDWESAVEEKEKKIDNKKEKELLDKIDEVADEDLLSLLGEI